MDNLHVAWKWMKLFLCPKDLSLDWVLLTPEKALDVFNEGLEKADDGTEWSAYGG